METLLPKVPIHHANTCKAAPGGFSLEVEGDKFYVSWEHKPPTTAEILRAIELSGFYEIAEDGSVVKRDNFTLILQEEKG